LGGSVRIIANNGSGALLEVLVPAPNSPASS
jgi:hypothetical protein